MINLENLQGIPNVVFLADDVIGGGAPSKEALTEIKKQGFRAVIDLRTMMEGTVLEKIEVKKTGLNYFNIPVNSLEISEDQVSQLAAILSNAQNKPALVHCAVGGRVQALWEQYQTAGQ